MKKKRSERRKHCALAVVRRSQKFSPRRRPLPGGAELATNFRQLLHVSSDTSRLDRRRRHSLSVPAFKPQKDIFDYSPWHKSVKTLLAVLNFIVKQDILDCRYSYLTFTFHKVV